MRRSLKLGTAALLGAVLVGCGGPGAPGELGPGGELCYRIVENEAATTLRLPWGMALSGDPAALARPGDRRAAGTLTEDGDRSLAPFGSWVPLPGDSVRVGPLIMGSVQLRLAAEDGVLRGLARPIGDVVGPGATPRPAVEGVVAEPVSCPRPR